jgi:hypothetical protein
MAQIRRPDARTRSPGRPPVLPPSGPSETLSKLPIRRASPVMHAGQEADRHADTRKDFETLIARPAHAHPRFTDAAGAPPGRPHLGAGRSRAAGRRLDPHADDGARCSTSSPVKPPDNSLAVSEVVARGAALHAGIVAAQLDDDDRRSRVASSNVLWPRSSRSTSTPTVSASRSATDSGRTDQRYPDPEEHPAADRGASRVYYTVGENQQRVRVRVLQGDATQAGMRAFSVGECWVEDLPPGLPKGAPVQVRCAVAANGLIDVHGSRHDERPHGSCRNSPNERLDGRRDRPAGGVGEGAADSVRPPQPTFLKFVQTS